MPNNIIPDSDIKETVDNNNRTEVTIGRRILTIISICSFFLLIISNIFRESHIISALKSIVPLLIGVLILSVVIVFATKFVLKLLSIKTPKNLRIVSVIISCVVSVLFVWLSADALIIRLSESLGFGGAIADTFTQSTIINNTLNVIVHNYVVIAWIITVILGLLSFWIVYYLVQLIVSSVVFNLKDGRKEYIRRFLLLVAPAAFLLFLYLIYSPLEIFFGNPEDMGIVIFSDIIIPTVIIYIGSVLLLTFFLSLFSGKRYSVILCAIFGVGVSSYIQMMFLNGSLGILDGRINAILENPGLLVLNCLIWCGIIAVVFVLYHFFQSNMEKIIKYVSIALCIVLIVATISMVCTAPASAFERNTTQILSSENQFKLSPNDNVVLFIVDCDSNEYLDSVLASDEKWRDVFSDFTYYTNAENRYMGTIPSVNHMLSGYDFDPSSTALSEWFHESWKSDNTTYIYNSIKDKGYDICIYTSSNLLGGVEILSASGLITNIVPTDGMAFYVDSKTLISNLLKTSCYRLFPYLAKLTLFNTLPGNYENCVYFEGTASPLENYNYYNKLINTQLSLMPTENNLFTVTHIEGTHPPYHTTELCEYADSTSVEESQIGCLVLLEEYLNQINSLGVYDNATIIITADHGNHGYYTALPDQQPIFLIKEPHAYHAALQENPAPITHCEILPTILSLLGVDYSSKGLLSIYDIDSNTDRTRVHYDYDDEGYYLCEYTGDRNTLFEKLKSGDTVFIPKR